MFSPRLTGTSYEDTFAFPGATSWYAVRGLNGCGPSASSSCVAAAPSPLPTITGGYFGCEDQGLALSTQAFASYQWTRDGADIPGATARDYTAHVGGTHTVRTTDAAGCIQSSAPLLVEIRPSPHPTVAGSHVGCVSTGAPLTTQSYALYWWYKDGVAVSGATARNYTATTPGSYAVRVSDGICATTSPPVTVTLNDPQSAVSGDVANACPAIRVPLQADAGYATYQWRRDGFSLPGATSASYLASLSGSYSVLITDAAGCTGTSPGHTVAVTFCPASEVSPEGAIFPARLVKDAVSPTGYYLYFQRLDGALGYSLYEGVLGTWYSHGGASGNTCNFSATELGTGEMQSAVTPTNGDHYYFVTAFNEAVEGPSGYATSGVEVDPLQSSCGP